MLHRRASPNKYASLRGGRLAAALLVAGFALLGLAAAACEYPGIPHPLAAQAQATGPQTSPTGEPAPAVKPEARTSPGPAVALATTIAEGKITVRLEDFKLNPDRLTAKAGAITFFFENAGRYTHDFRVEGQGLDEKSPKIGAGRNLEWEISLKPGEYNISCPISNHADRGMTGKLVVAP